ASQYTPVAFIATCAHIDPVFRRARGVFGQAELFEPVRDLLHRDPSPRRSNRVWTRARGSLSENAPAYTTRPIRAKTTSKHLRWMDEFPPFTSCGCGGCFCAHTDQTSVMGSSLVWCCLRRLRFFNFRPTQIKECPHDNRNHWSFSGSRIARSICF